MTESTVARRAMSPAEVVELVLGVRSHHPADLLDAVANELVLCVAAHHGSGVGSVSPEVLEDALGRLVCRIVRAVELMRGDGP